MEIAADLVKELRVKTGAGIMDCKEALKVSNGNFEKAVDFLREKGLSAATMSMQWAGQAVAQRKQATHFTRPCASRLSRCTPR